MKADIEFKLEKYIEAESSIRKALSIDHKLDVREKAKLYIKMSKMAQRKDYYKIMGLPKDTS